MFTPLRKGPKPRLTVQRVGEEWARVRREDGTWGRVSLDRLLARDEEGKGAHYRFHGWKPLGRGYRVEFEVLGVDESVCTLRLPEWDPDERIVQPLGILPLRLRRVGASGSCMANMGSRSAAALNIHSCKAEPAPTGSREERASYPALLVSGQTFRRRRDERVLRVVDVEQGRIRAWNGERIVLLDRHRLLELRADGDGRWYEYLGGGASTFRRLRRTS